MEKVSTILQMIFWLAIQLCIWIGLAYLALFYVLSPVYHAIVQWLEFGFWQIETFGSFYGLSTNSSWVGWSKIVSFFAEIPTWWPTLLVLMYGFVVTLGPWEQFLYLRVSLTENDDLLDETKEDS